MRVLTWNVDGLRPVLLRKSMSLSKMLEALDAGEYDAELGYPSKAIQRDNQWM